MSERAAKADRRKVRKVLGEGAPVLLEAHEEGLKAHAEIMRRTLLAGFWGRLRWLLFGVPQDRPRPRNAPTSRQWKSLGSALRRLKPGPPVLERADA